MRRLVSSTGLATAVALLAACDTIYGINREAPLPFLPDLACVEAAITSVPEVRSVRRWTKEGGRPLTLTGIKPPEQLYYFTYDLGSAKPTLLLSVDYKGRVELSQSLIRINVRLPQEQVDLARPVMIRIEKALEERCGVGPLEIDEYCSWVDCDAE